MTPPLKVTATLMSLTLPSPICRIVGIRLDHPEIAHVESIRYTIIKAVPIARGLITFPGKSSHVLKRVLTEAERASKLQQLLPGHDSLICPTTAGRGINRRERKKWTGGWVRRIAEIEQRSSPRILCVAVAYLESRSVGGEKTACLLRRRIIPPADDAVDLGLRKRGRRRGR
jgi:hypothetical protein